MKFEIPKETNTGKIIEVSLGATETEGGTRSNRITIGGWNSLRCLKFEGSHPHKPIVSMDAYDIVPEKYPMILKSYFGSTLDIPTDMARKCVEEYAADMINIRLESTRPEKEAVHIDETIKVVESIKIAVSAPLIITGYGSSKKNSELIKKICELTAGENCLINWVEIDDYQMIAEACMTHNHALVAQIPSDINLAKKIIKQLHDMNFPKDKIVINPSTNPLGYGLENSYSTIEMIVNEALAGDELLSYPMIVCPGYRTSIIRENLSTEEETPELGHLDSRDACWEISTAMSLFIAGADLLIMSNPKAAQAVKISIDDMFNSEEVA